MLYWLGKVIFWVFFTVFCRWEVTGRENVPRRGPVVVVSNHISLWDPIAVGVALPRRVYFMAKEELFRLPLVGLVLRGLGAFPVRRGEADLAAMRQALRLLRQGKVVGIFPEGGRSRRGTLEEFQRGAALLALRTQAPLLPVALIGTNRILGRRGAFYRFKVRVGPPIWPAPEAMLAKGTEVERYAALAQEAVGELLRQTETNFFVREGFRSSKTKDNNVARDRGGQMWR
ncbi:MAG: lysophospholipid acyltransferase family protein [Moorellales bacterium]